nr:trichohyalin-like [Nomia melanderi]
MALSERGLTIGPRVPRGLASAVEGLAREILRYRPQDVYAFAAHHFEHLVELREHSRAVDVSRILDRASRKEKHRILFDWICRDKCDPENEPSHDRYRRSDREGNDPIKEAALKETRAPSASKLLARRRRRRRSEEETTNRSGWSIGETVKVFKKHENEARKRKSRNAQSFEKSVEKEVHPSHREQRSPQLSKTIAHYRFLRSLSVGDVYLAKNISRCLEKSHEDTKRNNECNKPRESARTLKRQRSAGQIEDARSSSRVRQECVYHAARRSHSLVNVILKGRGPAGKEEARRDQLTGNEGDSFETHPRNRQFRRESFSRGLEAKERKRLEEEKARGSTEAASKLNFRAESDEASKDNGKAERIDVDGAKPSDNPESVILPSVVTKQSSSRYPEDTAEQEDPNYLVLPPISSDASKTAKKDNLLPLPLLSTLTETIETNRQSAVASDRRGSSDGRRRHSELEASSDSQDSKAENDRSVEIERSSESNETADANEYGRKEEVPKFEETEPDASILETRILKVEDDDEQSMKIEYPSDHDTANADECKEEVPNGSKDDDANADSRELSRKPTEPDDTSVQQSRNEGKAEESYAVANELKSKLIEIEMVEKNIENTLTSSETVLIADDDHGLIASASSSGKSSVASGNNVIVADAALEDVDRDSLDSPIEDRKQFKDRGRNSADTGDTRRTRQVSNDEDPSCYVLTEGSPCEIPESVTTVIIPDKEADSDDEVPRFEPGADSFGEYVAYPAETFEYSSAGMEFLRDIEDAVDRTISRKDLANIKEEEETEKDASDSAMNARARSIGVELESLERDEDATTETTDRTSNREPREAASNEGEHTLLSDITEPCVPELNLSSFRDTSSVDDRSDSINSEGRLKEDKELEQNAVRETEITFSSIDSLSRKEHSSIVDGNSSLRSKTSENEASMDLGDHSVENNEDKCVQTVADDQSGKDSNAEEEIARELIGKGSPDVEDEIARELIEKGSPDVEEEIARELMGKDSPDVEEEIARELIGKDSPDVEEEIARELIGKDSPNVEEEIDRELIRKDSPGIEEEIARELIRKDSLDVEEEISRELIGKNSPNGEEEIEREVIGKKSPNGEEEIEREAIRKDSPDVEEEISRELIGKKSPNGEEEIEREAIRKDFPDVEEEISRELIGKKSPNGEEEIEREAIRKDFPDVEEEISRELIGKKSPNGEEEIEREAIRKDFPDVEEEILRELIGKKSPNGEEKIEREVIRKDSPDIEEETAKELIEKDSPHAEEKIKGELIRNGSPDVEEEISRELIGKNSANGEEEIAKELIKKDSPNAEEEITIELIKKDSPGVEEEIAKELIEEDSPNAEEEITIERIKKDSLGVEEEIAKELIEKDSPNAEEEITRELIRKDSLDVEKEIAKELTGKDSPDEEEEIARELIRKDSLDVEEEIASELMRKDSLDVDEEISRELTGKSSPNVEEEIAKELIGNLTDEISMLTRTQDTTATAASFDADESSNFCSTSQLNATVSDKHDIPATVAIEPGDISMVSTLNGENCQENVNDSIRVDAEDETEDSNSNDIEKATIVCEKSSENDQSKKSKEPFIETLDQPENSEKLLIDLDQPEESKDPVTDSSSPTITLDTAARVIQIWVRKFLSRRRKNSDEQNGPSTPNTATILSETSQSPREDAKPGKGEGFVISNDEFSDPQKSEESRASEVSGSEQNEKWPPMVATGNTDDERRPGDRSSTVYSSRHTGEFHDSLPLPILELPKDKMLRCMRESAKPVHTPFFDPESPQACVLLAFGFPNSLLDDGSNWKGYVGFPPSASDFKREANGTRASNPTEEHSDSDVDSIREPLALDGTSKSILIEEITTADEEEHAPQDNVEERTSSPVDLVDSDNRKSIEEKEGPPENSDESKSTQPL